MATPTMPTQLEAHMKHHPTQGNVTCIDPTCGARHDHPIAGTHATCILRPDHTPWAHWGPDQHGIYHEWRT